MAVPFNKISISKKKKKKTNKYLLRKNIRVKYYFRFI